MSNRAFYSNQISSFIYDDSERIIGTIAEHHSQDVKFEQTWAWKEQIHVLKRELNRLNNRNGAVYFEYMIPRMGRRADVVLIYEGLIFVIEFKAKAKRYNAADIRQAHGYALDLKNFHSGSHNRKIIPMLVATGAATNSGQKATFSYDGVSRVITSNGQNLALIIDQVSIEHKARSFSVEEWSKSSFKPTPTIVEAAQALYSEHAVEEISRSEAGTKNISSTSYELMAIIHQARRNHEKIVCFVTGVPGAGKTLVGLNIASQHSNPKDDEYAVFLSGNGPLVAVLLEALSRDKVLQEKEKGKKISKKQAEMEVEQFVQSIHHFRDEYIKDSSSPNENVLLYDEAQRAWNSEQASSFMRRKRGLGNFNQSEPEFLMDVMARHEDWAVIVALIGGGQEINTGESGLLGWIDALKSRPESWKAYCSEELLSGDYVTDGLNESDLNLIQQRKDLHLSTSMRSFRAERVSDLVHHLIEGNSLQTKRIFTEVKHSFPITVTRDLNQARDWVREQRRGNESSGILASSNAIRLKPEGLFVKNKIDPPVWFLNPPEDVRSCHALEDCATEFDVQGLELDWALVAWDADYRYNGNSFEHWRFVGSKWTQRKIQADKRYLANAYRVLLTRARQGMVIFIPKGDSSDPTRPPEFYDQLYTYLIDCGLPTI